MSGAENKKVGFTTVAAGLGVAVVVGVLMGVAVLVSAAVAVGNGVALEAIIGVGTAAGMQADNIRLTSKSTINVRFIVRFLLWRSMPPNGTRFSRREASAASEAVGWKRMLGG